MDFDIKAELDPEVNDEVIKMGRGKPCSPLAVNMSIARRKYNHRRSMSEQIDNRSPLQFGNTLAQLIGTSYRLSGVQSTVDGSSERILDSPRSAISASSFSGQDADRRQRKILELNNCNDELQAYCDAQASKIAELENKIDDLFEVIDAKEQERVHALNCTALAEKRLQKMAMLETDNWKMSVEIENLRQEQEERLEQANLEESRPLENRSTKLLMNYENGNDKVLRDKDEHIEALQQKIHDINRELNQKQKEVNELQQQLHIKELGLMELETRINETSRQKTNVEDELDAASREMDNLRKQATTFEDTVKERDSKLQSLEQLLEAEKEATRMARVEKERVVQKLQELKTQKHIKDKTFMDLYHELLPTVNAQLIEDDSEHYWSEGCQGDDATEIEGYCHLQFDQDSRRRSRTKSKPSRAPPPIPTKRVNKKSTNISRCEIDDETKRLNQADYEYFLMSSIAVRMNLVALFKNDEIMAVDVDDLWKISRNSQVPMNTYYFYIEDALRKEFNLPEIDCPHTTWEQQTPETPKGCCILM